MPDNPQEPTPSADLNTYRLERAEGDADYSAKDLQHLSDLEHVRERPSMYIGDTTPAACTTWSTKSSTTRSTRRWPASPREISVTINNDGSVTVEDNGRGIPVELHPDLGFSTLQGVMTVLKFGGKFEQGGLSNLRRPARRGRDGGQLPLRVVRGRGPPRGHVYQQEYERGVPVGRRPPHRHAPTGVGTKTTFKPDSADLPQHQVRVQHPLPAACRNWPSSTAA